MTPSVLGTVFFLCLSACTAVGPNYQPPAQEMPQQWNTTAAALAPTTGRAYEKWWTLFNDPILESLVAEAAAANPNLRKAEARIREARAQRVIAVASSSLGGSAGASSSRRSDNVGATGGKQDLFQLGFDAGWELDLFGGLQRAGEAAEANLAASHEDLRDVLVSLQAEVASNYLDLRGSQNRLATTRNNIATQEKTVDLVRGSFQMGLGNELDLMNAETQLALTKAAMPTLQRSIQQAMHQIAILLGQAPASLISRLSEETGDIQMPPQIPIDLPSELLRQRPDIRAAERRLAAATAEIGVATAELFPKFSLSGLLGLQSRNLSDLVTSGSRYWSIGPTLSLSLIDQGRIRAGIEISNARRDQALAGYEVAVLAALAEVENALVAFTAEQDTESALTKAVTSGKKAVNTANGMYEAGLTDFLNVLQSERALYQSEDQLEQSRQRLSLSLVAIFKALGGGWQVENNKPSNVEKIPPANNPT